MDNNNNDNFVFEDHNNRKNIVGVLTYFLGNKFEKKIKPNALIINSALMF